MRPSLKISKSNTQPKAHPYRSVLLRTLMDFCSCSAQSMFRAVLSFREILHQAGDVAQRQSVFLKSQVPGFTPQSCKAKQHNTAQNKTKLEWNFKKYSSTQLPSYGKQLMFLQCLGSALLEFHVNGLTSCVVFNFSPGNMDPCHSLYQ